MVFDIPQEWTDIYSLASINQGDLIYLQNVGRPGDVIAAIEQDSQPLDTDRGSHLDQLKAKYRAGNGVSKIWVRYIRQDFAYPNRVCPLSVEQQSSIELEQSIPKSLFNEAPQGFQRLQTESLQLSQKYIVDGIGLYLQWIEQSFSNGSSVYLRLRVPDGYYLALDYRELLPEKERIFYYVYTPDTNYVVGQVLGSVPVGNLRSDSGFPFTPVAERVTLSVVPEEGAGGTAGDKADKDQYNIVRVPAFGQAGSGSGNRATGGLSSDTIFRLIDPNAEFILELYNDGAGPSEAQLNLVFAMVPAASVYPSIA